MTALPRPSLSDRRSRNPNGLPLRGLWPIRLFASLVWLIALLLLPVAVHAGERTDVEQRLYEAVKYLASDKLEGRGLDTEGITKAAHYLAEQFEEIGIETEHYGGAPFQKFTVSLRSEPGPAENNAIALVGPADGEAGSVDEQAARRRELQPGRDFNTLAIGGTSLVAAPLVFAGYGITAPEHDYDDYASLDADGKVVVILRKEPQQDNPHSVFNGTDSSRHALFSQKISNAYQQGAAAVILVNDRMELQRVADERQRTWDRSIERLAEAHREFQEKDAPTPEEVQQYHDEVRQLAERIVNLSQQQDQSPDELLSFTGAGAMGSHRSLPVFFARRDVVDPIVQESTGQSLAEIEAAIDRDLQPRSAVLDGWRAEVQSDVRHKEVEIKNVIGVLPGHGELADETIVIGAHYDHLGYGGQGNSLAPGTIAIHPGADDNASGTAALVEVARRFVDDQTAPRRRIVFIAFTGEETGLLGSAHYVREPLYPLEKTVAMLNMDMVGRLRDDNLIVHGTGTAQSFDELIDSINEGHGFDISKQPGGFGPSDHASFYGRQIPVLHFFTGTHQDYHRPSDTYDKINYEGLARVVDFVFDAAQAIDQQDERPQYREVARQRVARRGGERPYLGSIPDFGRPEEGYALMGVAPGSPAEKAGLKAGDVIIQFGDSRIAGLEDIDSALRRYQAGDRVEVVVLRDEEQVKRSVVLDPPQ